jgi:hypothetical protein
MKRLLFSLTFVCSLQSVQAQAVKVIFRGTVVMEDGSAPGKSVGTQRNCTDANGGGPGPLTNKEGVFTWSMEVDYMRTRRCFLLATLNGYESTQVDISNVNPATSVNVDLPPIKLKLKGSDPYAVGGPDKDVPAKGRAEWTAAMKALTASDMPGATQQLKAATAANPKFALAWHNLGILQDFQRQVPEAREAYAKAIEANPKMLAPFAALNRLLVRERDWAGVLKNSAAMIPLDKDRIFPELYAFQAAAHYNLKDLAAAEAAASEAMNPKAKRVYPRAEYVLGRILEAKGDAAGAKQHMLRYLELAPSAEDAAQIKAHMNAIGTPGAPEPELVLLTR